MKRRPARLTHAATAHAEGGARPRIRRWVIGLPVLVVLAMLLGVGIASGWLPSLVVPRKIVVRGNAIIPAQTLLAVAGQDRQANAYRWWQAFAGLDAEQVRWLASAKPGLGLGRTLVVDVTERRPLLHVEDANRAYWLCEDYQLVPVDAAQDTHPAFAQIAQLPQVKLEGTVEELAGGNAQALVLAAACLHRTLPGVIKLIKLDQRGELWCYDQQGFTIKLGTPEQLEEKIAALPKALRICAAERRKLQYLDASDPRIFYQRWQEPPQT